MRNKRQFVGAFVIAAVLGAAMPLSAETAFSCPVRVVVDFSAWVAPMVLR